MPPSSSRLLQPGSRGWLRVVVAMVVALPVAFFAWRAAFAFAFAPIAPEAVLSFHPGYPTAIEVKIARGLVGPNQELIAPTPAQAAEVRSALQRQPMSSRGLRLVAMGEDAQGASPAALKYLKLAHELSRRDVVTEVMLGRDAITREDTAAAMRYFDAALATSSDAQQLLFPVMAKTMTVPALRREMVKYVDREWAGNFLNFAVSQADPEFVEELALNKPEMQKGEAFAEFRSQLISRYAAAGELGKAQRYASMVAGNGNAISAFGITPASTDQSYAPVTWRLANELDVVADMDGEGVFATVNPGSRGTVMYRELALASGVYDFAMNYAVVGLASDFSAEWRVECVAQSGSRGIAAIPVPFSSATAIRKSRIVVPGGCRAVTFTLSANNFDDQTSAELTIQQLSLEKASG